MIFDYRNVHADPSKLPPFLPQLNYNATFRLSTGNNVLIFELNVKGSVEKPSKRNPKRNRRT